MIDRDIDQGLRSGIGILGTNVLLGGRVLRDRAAVSEGNFQRYDRAWPLELHRQGGRYRFWARRNAVSPAPLTVYPYREYS